MKKIILLFGVVCIALLSKAQIQPDPAHWAYGLKKIQGNVYEVHLRCTIDDPWHIYAQKQGKDFIGTRTKIVFDKQVGLKLIGAPVEVGKKVTFTNKEVGITNLEYAGEVDFVQKATISTGVTQLKGTINYQTCTDQRCLTATSVNFILPVIN